MKFSLNRNISLPSILTAISEVSGIKKNILLSKTRYREIVDARHAFLLIADNVGIYGQEEIENFVNLKHASLFHAYKKAHLKEIKDIINKVNKHIHNDRDIKQYK